MGCTISHNRDKKVIRPDTKITQTKAKGGNHSFCDVLVKDSPQSSANSHQPATPPLITFQESKNKNLNYSIKIIRTQKMGVIQEIGEEYETEHDQKNGTTEYFKSKGTISAASAPLENKNILIKEKTLEQKRHLWNKLQLLKKISNDAFSDARTNTSTPESTSFNKSNLNKKSASAEVPANTTMDHLDYSNDPNLMEKLLKLKKIRNMRLKCSI